MNAEQARVQAANINNQANASSLKEVELAIESAVKKGEFSCWIYSHINDTVRGELTKRGFIVGAEQSDRNEILTEIAW